jgi:hypothetical protein
MTNRKPAFVLLITMVLVILFSFYSLTILENNRFGSELNRLKYMHLQALIHIDYINKFILSSNDEEIFRLTLDDNRYKSNIVKIMENNSSVYYITVSTNDNTPIRLSRMVVK